jgi:hypothetical protein
MRCATLVVALCVCSCEKSKPKAEPAPAAPAAPAEGGSYSDLVKQTQSAPPTETRTELACSKQYLALSKEERHEVKLVGKDRCPQADMDARFACYDKREKALGALSAEELWKQADEDELVSAVATRLVAAAEQGVSLAAAERELLAAYLFDSEVRNGGFHQFFFNPSGDDALDARAGLARFGMTTSPALLDCAMTAFPDSKPSKDRETRNDQLARWGDKQFELFSTITEAYFVVDDEEWQRAYPYVRDHRSEFPNTAR